MAQYRYDGLNRRVSKWLPDGTWTGYYYNKDWQLLEERAVVSGEDVEDPLAQYVWHPNYVDALAVRFYDADTDGDLDENNDGAQYYLQDANYNVTAVLDAGGAVLERYTYTAYGEVTFLEPDFDEAATQQSIIGNEHLYTGRERDAETGLSSSTATATTPATSDRGSIGIRLAMMVATSIFTATAATGRSMGSIQMDKIGHGGSHGHGLFGGMMRRRTMWQVAPPQLVEQLCLPLSAKLPAV